MGKNLIWLNYGGMKKEVYTLRLISRFFEFFHLPGYNYTILFLLLKHELKPNCFDNRIAEIFPESYSRKPRWFIAVWILGSFRRTGENWKKV
jgi:hypothetical protein